MVCGDYLVCGAHGLAALGSHIYRTLSRTTTRPPAGATGAPGTAPERRRIPVRCAETPAIDFLARGSYTPRRFKPHDAHRGRPGAPGGLFLAKNVRLYHNLMFLTPWGAAGRQNQLSFFDEFGCTILAPGKKIIIVKVHFQAVTVRPGGPEFSPGAMWYMVRDHDGYGDKKNPSTFVLVFKKIDSPASS